MAGKSDTALVRRLNEVAVERGMTQEEVAERSGIPQSTISRWFAAIEEGDAVPLRPKNRNAIRSFLARAESDTGDRAALLGRLIAADILEEIAHQLRSEAGNGRPTPSAARDLEMYEHDRRAREHEAEERRRRETGA